MNAFAHTNLTIINSTEAEFSDLYQDSFAGANAFEEFCDGDGACCCCCCCC